MSDSDLYSRQRVLREIGSLGQERLRASTYAPSAGLTPAARKMAIIYATAAGWGKIGPTREGAPHAAVAAFRHQAAADVGLGALDVLSASLPHFDIAATERGK